MVPDVGKKGNSLPGVSLEVYSELNCFHNRVQELETSYLNCTGCWYDHTWEYCAQFRMPNYNKDIIKLERMLKRFTRILPRLWELNYKARLDRLRLFLPGACEAEG